MTPELLEKYYVIYKGHIEGDDAIPEGVIEAPMDIETQDLILVSDIVLTDYSSIIFDALTIDKKFVYILLTTKNIKKNVASILMC